MYNGKPTTQLDGSYYAHSNCVVAQASTLTDAVSFSYWDPSPKALRVITKDTSGGITYGAAAAAVKVATNGEVVLKALYWADDDTLEDMIDDGRATGISILCSVTRYTPFRTGTYTGRHCIGVYMKRYVTLADGTKQKQGLVMDPGHSTAKFVWWPWSLILKAARASTGTTSKIHLLYTADRTAARKVIATGPVRTSPKVVDSPSNVVTRAKADSTVTILDTTTGGSYTYGGRTFSVWAKIGTNRYIAGANVRKAA